MNKILKQIIQSCKLVQNEQYSFCYEPVCAYEYTGTMLSYNEDKNTVGVAESISYTIESNNTPVIMFCGFTFYDLNTENYNNIVQQLYDVTNQLRSTESSIKQHLVNEQLELVKKDF